MMRARIGGRVLLFGFTIATLLALYLLCHSAVLSSLTRDGTIETKRVLSSALFYAILVNGIAWLLESWRKNRGGVILSGVTVLLCTVAVHIAAPYLLPAHALPRYRTVASRSLHHVIPASTRMFAGEVDGRQVFVQTNEDGLRTRYSRDQFLALRTRVAVLGDSFAFGYLVGQDKAWPELLETALRRHLERDDIGVLNAGVVSYSPLLEHRQFDQVVAYYKPNLVILLLDPSDIGDDYKYAAELNEDNAWPITRPAPSMRSGLWPMSQPLRQVASFPFDFCRHHLLPKPSAVNSAASYDYYDFRVLIDGTSETNRFFIYRHPLEKTRAYFDFTFSNVTRIAQACHEMGSRFVLVPTPRFQHWNTSECPANWERNEYKLDEPYQFEFFRYFVDRGSDDGIEVFNLLEVFARTDRFPLVFASDPHWNEAGHAFVAQAARDYLLEHHMDTFARPQQ